MGVVIVEENVVAHPEESLRNYTESTNMSHTILLVQPQSRPESRTYSDYESVNECLEGVCKIYEEHLKRMNPNIPSITYDISQLFDFIDQLADLSCLVYQRSTNTYAPYNKSWIKEKSTRYSDDRQHDKGKPPPKNRQHTCMGKRMRQTFQGRTYEGCLDSPSIPC